MRQDDFQALVEQRREAHATATEINREAEREKRNLTDDEQRSWDGALREMERLGVRSTWPAPSAPPRRPGAP